MFKRFSALALTLFAAGCPADENTPTTGTEETSTGSTSPTSTSTSPDPTTSTTTPDPTTTLEPTTAAETTGPATTEGTTEPVGTTTTGETTTTTTGETTAEGTSSTGPVGEGVCGNGELEAGEACDDGNLVTELSKSANPPLAYADGDCIDDCSLVLGTCGDGQVDPGEQCDDGNTNSYDACTTSCIANDGAAHAPCTRTCGAGDNCDTNIAGGDINGCDDLEVPAGAAKVCFDSTTFNLAKRYFPEGECLAAAQSCSGGVLCPPNVGDTTKLVACPAGTSMVSRTTETFGIKVTTKVCHKTCESDAECRWNGYDAVWKAPGRFRCQTTPDSNNVKICADAQNSG